MTDRIKRRLQSIKVDKYPICTERIRYALPSYERNEGLPVIVKRAQGIADYLDNRTIFIMPDDLIVGNAAEKFMGMEVQDYSPAWPDDDLDDLLAGGQITMTDEDRRAVRATDDFFLGKGKSRYEMQGRYYNDERIWPFIKKGFLCPPWQKRNQGRGWGEAGCGWGNPIGPTVLFTPDYGTIISMGYEEALRQVREARKAVYYDTYEAIKRTDFYDAAEITLSAMLRIAKRYSALAAEMAEKEQNPQRRAELLKLSEICERVPAKPARTFHEAIQAFFFYFLYGMTGTIPGGRFDQFMYPYYKADLEAGRITREEALELIEILRIKIMEINYVGGGKGQRDKWAGMARWHNFVIGGCDEDGNDASNEISYLVLEAALETHTPHPTISLRVSKNTPPELMRKAMEVVRSGMGMPAFLSEDNYIKFMTDLGVPLREARKFAIAGCLEVQIPGASRNFAFGMTIVPMILEIAMHNGRDAKTGYLYGVEAGEFESFETFDDFYAAFLKQYDHIISLVNEEHNIQLAVHRDAYPDAFTSVFMRDGIKDGLDGLSKRMLLENGSAANHVGMSNLINSLVSIEKLVYREKKVTAAELLRALDANWEGYEHIREMCLAAPKYGNGSEECQKMSRRVWHDFSEIVKKYKTIYGAPLIPTATSITAHAPGGAQTGATPDGRYAGETLADGSTSPVQGTDANGPLAVFRDAMAVDQSEYMATLMNMKFSPATLKTDEDLDKLAAATRAYLTGGGKQVQYNVVDAETLRDAKRAPASHRDLIVRVAGYSSYFTVLTPRVQDEIINRSEQAM